MTDDDHLTIVQALATEHRAELGRLRALCAVYRALLETAGIDAPGDTHGAEALRRYRLLFEQHGLDDAEQHNELISNWWGRWPAPKEPAGGPWAAPVPPPPPGVSSAG